MDWLRDHRIGLERALTIGIVAALLLAVLALAFVNAAVR